jgi:hypothetical protein
MVLGFVPKNQGLKKIPGKPGVSVHRMGGPFLQGPAYRRGAGKIHVRHPQGDHSGFPLPLINFFPLNRIRSGSVYGYIKIHIRLQNNRSPKNGGPLQNNGGFSQQFLYN